MRKASQPPARYESPVPPLLRAVCPERELAAFRMVPGGDAASTFEAARRHLPSGRTTPGEAPAEFGLGSARRLGWAAEYVVASKAANRLEASL